MRATATDFLHNMRFHVTAAPNAGRVFLPLSDGAPPQAGFSTCGSPSASVESVMYREGHYVYTRKQPGGIPTTTDIEMTRGVTRTDTDFWNWLRAVIEGDGEYRTDLTIKVFTRDALPNRFGNREPDNSSEQLDVSNTNRGFQLFEAFPNSHKPGTDLDANNNEISIMSLGIAYESFEVIPAT